jgi:hypothetical protein
MISGLQFNKEVGMETPASSFGREHFGGAELGDKRRSRRLRQLADVIVQHPGGTWPDRFKRPADLKAFYRLMNEEEVTHAKVLTPHRQRTLQRMAEQSGVVLTIHDTTELDFSGLTIEGLGQIGEGHGRGYKSHNSLAVVAESGEVLGLANQILFKRRRVPKGETKAQRQRCAKRESLLWKQGSQAVPAAPEGCTWVDVCDRGADITEFLDYEHRHNKKYVVRSQHNRYIVLEKAGEFVDTKLHDWARTLSPKDRRAITIGGRNGKPARKATVQVAWGQVRIKPPPQPRGEHGREPLLVWVLRVWEDDPPNWVDEPVEWILLTNMPVNSVADAWERVDWYCRRWIIEEYHKALKTGCNIEDQQFTTEENLQPAIAVLSVVAVTLLNLRDASRQPDAHSRRATDLVPHVYVDVLSKWRHKKIRRHWSLYDFYYALARLGGHQNRKNDHPPGWLVLWRGWTKLQLMVEAVSIMSG